MSKKLTKDEFITKSKQVHGDKYDYSLVEYVNNRTKVKIICPGHGIFEQRPFNHLRGEKCSACACNVQLTKGEFITKAKQVHGDKYDYSLVEYKGNKTKVKIVCPEHGVFEQRPDNHIYNSQGCMGCFNKTSRQELDLLDYIKSIYKGEIITNTRKVITPYELDIYLPDIHKAFEYNGMYWHTEGLNKPIGYHQMKNDLCSHRGINLMHVWEHDWMNDNRFMKEVIKREVIKREVFK